MHHIYHDTAAFTNRLYCDHFILLDDDLVVVIVVRHARIGSPPRKNVMTKNRGCMMMMMIPRKTTNRFGGGRIRIGGPNTPRGGGVEVTWPWIFFATEDE